MELEFTKLSGAGNDFIVINNMDGELPEEGRRELFIQWCRRGVAIGADGVLLTEPASPDSNADFRMRYYNADGGEAETCGNGSRCIARFAHMQGIAERDMKFQTLAGDYTAHVLDNGHVRVSMSDAFGLKDAITRATISGVDIPVHFVNTGVPHAVIIIDDVAAAPVKDVGRELRYHEAFAPAGTNVNFARVTGSSQLQVRTYERGVEDETLACGTGCIASSIIAARAGRVSSPVEVTTASGEQLLIDFTLADDGAISVSLQGSANIIFRGYVQVEIGVPPATHQPL